MKLIIEYGRVPTTSANGEGIQIIQTVYSTPEEIERLEKACRENIGSYLLVIDCKEKQNEEKKVL